MATIISPIAASLDCCINMCSFLRPLSISSLTLVSRFMLSSSSCLDFSFSFLSMSCL
ncbi:hypothetical protein MBAV_001768 [Candidatus Magnetobacterium bavaricum]|uniref:Uncharacterized protein n=1 Tax=Candidatus Magnetobacterium bavaricum TaxID=29290 RepID=A0A0F3GVP3_9BACT|nr:hypothetical protein MBAV_001768 [Candidatus Magnetobacterium bavaricum]